MGVEEKGLEGYHFANWSQTFECDPELYFIPSDVEELREILFLAKNNGKKVRVVGCGHSPSDICCTDQYMINLSCFNSVLSMNRETNVVKVEAGITFAALNAYLDKHWLAFPVLGSISELTVGGAISTGTHGTGANFGILCTYVIDVELITSTGDTIKCSRDENSDIFLSALCGLGAIGIVTKVSLQCEPAFLLHQYTYPSTLDDVLTDLSDQIRSCDHYRFLWFPHTNFVSICENSRIYNKPITKYSKFQQMYNWFWGYGVGYYSLEFWYWISTFVPSIGPYINRIGFWLLYSKPEETVDISHKIFNIECLFKQYVNEWSIPVENTAKVLLELKHWIDTTPNIYAHFFVEVRFVKSDEIYLSTAYGRDSTFINIIMYRPYGKDVHYQDYWNQYEKIMKESGGRPHWAKAHRETAADFVKMYPYFKTWIEVRERVDPTNMFMNQYLERIFLKYRIINGHNGHNRHNGHNGHNGHIVNFS